MIVIPGDMPKNCHDCFAFDRGTNGDPDWCNVRNYIFEHSFDPYQGRHADCPLIRLKGGHKMNAKQALKAVSEQLKEYEELFNEQARLLNLYKADVKNFYECIEGTVDGKSICDWCEAYKECQLQDKGGKGCKEWEHILQQQEEGQDEG